MGGKDSTATDSWTGHVLAYVFMNPAVVGRLLRERADVH